MQYLTIIRILSIICIGLLSYIAILKALRIRLPGQFRRKILQDKICSKANWWIRLLYCFFITIILVFSILIIRYMVRGDI